MKKGILITLGCLVICASIVVGLKIINDSNNEEQDTISNNQNMVSQDESMEDQNSQKEKAILENPSMEWWELYNPNGFDTITAKIINHNKIAIDVSYDLVFYKDGKEISRIEDCLNEGIAPEHEDIIWANVGIPSSSEADDVRMENVQVTETIYSPIEGTYNYLGVVDGEAQYKFKFEKPIEIATIWFLNYNDNNKNGKFDKGEIVVAGLDNLLDQEGIASYDTNVFSSANCDVIFKAY